MLGVHANSAGGLAKTALGWVDEVGAGAVQVYIGNARSWTQALGDPLQDVAFLMSSGSEPSGRLLVGR